MQFLNPARGNLRALASEDRATAHHLTFLAQARETVRLWGLFPILRGAEARALDLPKIGRAKLPSMNIVDLGQTPTLSFANSTVDSIEVVGGRARVSGPWMGLTGPMGPLPTHLTEYALYEARYANARPFGQFLDLISGRMLQFFYRAWADTQPAAMLDRPEEDRFGDYIAALSGAREGATAESAFPAAARLHYAALFASRRSAVAIEDGLCDLLRQPVRIHEFQPHWRALEPGDQTQLGGGFATLGQGALLGGRARLADDAFRVVITPGSTRDYISLLPGRQRYAVTAAAIDALAPGHLEWNITLEVEERHAPPARLGGTSQLGWTSWMMRPSTRRTLRRDAHLRRQPGIQNQASSATN